MLRHCTMLVALMMTLTLVGCGDSHDAVMDDAVSLMERINGILDDVKDKESAEAAAGRLESAMEDLREITERANELDEPSEEALSDLQSKYEERLEAVKSDLLANMFRILALGDEVSEPIGEAMRSFDDDDVESPEWLSVD